VPRERGQKVVATNRKARHDYSIEDVFEAGIVLTGTSTRRKRKLLMHREEIYKLAGKVKESGYTLVPLSLYFKDGKAKVELALAKGKRDYDKRQALKEKQDKREADRAMSTKGKDW